MAWVLCLVVGAAVAYPASAEACSCGVFESPSPESCATATRVFAGTVASSREPNAFDLIARSAPWEVELVVDRVWRGDVPAVVVAFTGRGGGDCGYGVPVGTRFVVCDDKPGASAPTFHLCEHPAFDDDELERALGPTARPPDRRFAWLQRARRWVRPTWTIPVALTMAGALLGRVTRRRERPRERPLGLVAILIGVWALVGWMIAIRGVAHALDSKLLAGLGPIATASVIGAILGFVGQRRPTRLGGGALALVVALVGVGVMAVVGYVELPGTR